MTGDEATGGAQGGSASGPAPTASVAVRLLVPSSALFWGLQVALLNPALALVLVRLFGATTSEVGWALAAYNASGFVAALLIPVWADRRGDYLRPMLGCGLLSLLLAAVLAVTTSLGVVVAALVVLGGPGSVGTTLLFAHVRHSGAGPAEVVNTRAVFSVAWVAGPPLATALVATTGERSVPAAVAFVAVLGLLSTLALLRLRRTSPADGIRAPGGAEEVGGDGDGGDDVGRPAMPRPVVGVVITAFVALQATNATAVVVLALYVTQSLDLDVVWAGVALGVAAALEVPALLVLARLGRRHSSLGLIATGCLAGVAYYAGVAVVTGPALLVALQVLNAWFIAAVSGTGLAFFQEVIPRPGLASGLFLNTFRVGSVLTGPILVLGTATTGSQRGVFWCCAVLTAVALAVLLVVRRLGSPSPARH